MLALEAVPESGPLGARPVRCGAVVCAGARASAACADMPLSRTSLPLATVADLPEQRMAAHPRAHHPNQFVRPIVAPYWLFANVYDWVHVLPTPLLVCSVEAGGANASAEAIGMPARHARAPTRSTIN